MKIKNRFISRFLLGIFVLVNILTVYPASMSLDVQAAQGETVNHAEDSTVTASSSPINYWGPDKLTDGVVNRDDPKGDQSRWSSESGAPEWVRFDLKEEKTFNEFYFAWESQAQAAKDYHLEKSDDGTTFTTFYTAPTSTAGHPMDDHVTLDNPVTARYVRLVVDSLISTAYNSVSLFEVEINETVEFENLSLDAAITSNGQEAASVNAEKAHDGSVDTWWGSAVGSKPTWLALNYGEKKDINSMLIHWERKNASSYEIQTSEDGNTWTSVLTFNEKPSTFEQIINFDTSLATQYIRVLINAYDATAEKEDGTSVTWNTVGVIELETYGETLVIPEIPKLTPKEVADALTLTPVEEGDTAFVMPEVPEGYTISFVGADYEQILARDLNIIRPLVDRTLIVNFEVTDEETGVKAVSKDYEVPIGGLYDEAASVNEKPVVIPELQEWYGLSGEFTISDSSRIVVGDDLFMEAAKEMQKDYEDITGKPIEIVSGTPAAGDFYFTKNESLEEETYEMIVEDYLTVSASTNVGAYWSTRSILQILKQTGTTISQGYVKDYPKYEVRGFMFDVARKPFTLDFVYEVSKQMSWYKLNDLQLHINDNHIQSPSTYIGFRLESDIPNLSNTDLVYTKAEFTEFMNKSKNIGVNIVPEFDTPGHAAAFTRANPDIARGDEIEYLDVTNPAALEFVETVIDEYVDGVDPVFPEGTVLGVGTDEYKHGNKEAFRQYQNDILEYVRDDKGITPRVWGSQTENSGATPITVDGVQMSLWNNGYSNPKTMYELGYDLINTRDGDLYIVPGAGYYSDYINQTKIATTWEPNNIGGTIIPAGDEQMLGAAFAIWNDMIGNPAPQHSLRDNGFTELEVFDRFFAITPTFAAKLWGDINDYSANEINTIAAVTEYAPNSNPTLEVETKSSVIVDYSFDKDNGVDFSGNEYNLEEQKNVDYVEGNANNALQLNGGESYVETPLTNMGVDKTIDFWVKKDAGSGDEEQILFESELGSIKAVQKDTGKFGYSTDFRDHSFDYTLPDDEWVHLTLKTYFGKTELYVNGEKMDELSRSETGGLSASLIAPFERIGSTTNAFKGQIDDLVIYNEIQSDEINKIPHSNMTAQVDSAQSSDAGGKAAIDDNPSTIWHTKWDLSDPLPQSITLTFDKEYTVDKLTYLPRPTGPNGIITKYTVSVSLDGVTWDEVKAGTWANNGELKTAEFDPAAAKYIRLTALEGVGGFASAAEINVYRLQEELDTADLIALIETAEDKDLSLYTTESGEALEFEIREAKRALTSALTQAEIEDAETNLQAVIDELELLEDDTVDMQALQDLVDSVKDFKAETYTPDSFAVFQPVLAAAKAVLADPEATQEDVDSATATLQQAKDQLLARADMDALNALLDTAAGKVEEAYTSESWSAFADALENAEAVSNNGNATQEEVDAAASALSDAMTALTRIQGEGINSEALEQLIAELQKLDEKDYTAESWKQLQTALTAAKEVLANPDATQAEIDAQVAALQQAKDALVKNSTDDGKEDDSKGNGGKKSPATGDTQKVGLYIVVLVMSLAAVLYVIKKRKTRTR